MGASQRRLSTAATLPGMPRTVKTAISRSVAGPADDLCLWTLDGQGPTLNQVKGGGMDRWEYKIADLTKVEKDIGELNRLGAEGWEAVGMVSTWGAGVSFVHPIALLKRRVTDGCPPTPMPLSARPRKASLSPRAGAAGSSRPLRAHKNVSTGGRRRGGGSKMANAARANAAAYGPRHVVFRD